MRYEPGEKVYVEAHVLRIYHPDREERDQVVDLQLSTGQHLQTSPLNLRAVDDDEDEPEEGDEPTQTKARRTPKNKAKRPAADKEAARAPRGLSHSSFQAAAATPSPEKPAGKPDTASRSRNVEPEAPDREAVRNAEVSEQES